MSAFVRGRPDPRCLEPSYLAGNQVAIPPEQRVRRDNGAKCSEREPTDGLGLLCEPSTLRVRPANALVAKLLAELLILGLEILDHGLLLSVDPTRENKEQKLEVEIDRSLSSHDNFYHDEKAGITLNPFSAAYGVSVGGSNALGGNEGRAGNSPSDAGGCSCRVGGKTSPSGLLGLALGAALLFRRRRRP